MEVIHTIGRRKTSVARLFISKGKGNITVNKKAYNEFFPTATLQYKITQPLALTQNEGKFDLKVTVKVGGLMDRLRQYVLRFLEHFVNST